MKKYMLSLVLQEVDEEEYKYWDEDADVTSHAGSLHNPHNGDYLIGHSDLRSYKLIPKNIDKVGITLPWWLVNESLAKLKTACFDKNGGI